MAAEEEHEALPLTSEEDSRLEAPKAPTPRRKRLGRLAAGVILTGTLVAGLVLVLGLLVHPQNAGATRSNDGFNTSAAGESSSAARVHEQTGFHFQPRSNWMNDPNGPVFYRGYYHIFYQFNPRAPIWNMNMSWGHAASKDLVHWIHLPLALEPSHWYDSHGCWSGSITLVTLKGTEQPVILYTGISNSSVQTQNAAVPDDPADPLLKKWRKLGENPLIPAPPSGIGGMDFRDPSTAWKDSPNGPWRILIGAKNRSSGVGFLYESDDFIRWRRRPTPLFSVDGTGMWECPDFFPVSDSKHVFKASLGDPEIYGGVDESFDSYAIGRYSPDNGTFTSEISVNSSAAAAIGLGLRLDHGNRFYASKSFHDRSNNRRLLWGWLSEADSQAEDVAKGWASVQSVPRSIWLSKEPEEEEHLMQLPVDEIKALRTQPGVSRTNLTLTSGSTIHLLRGAQLDVEIIFRLPDLTAQMGMENFDVELTATGNAAAHCRRRGAGTNGLLGPFGLLVLATRGLEEQTAVHFRLGRSRRGLVALVCADHARSKLLTTGVTSSNSSLLLHGAFVHLVEPSMAGGSEQELSMRVLVDQSVVETFAQGGKVSLTSRVYPRLAKGDSANLFVFNNGTGTVQVKSLRAWKMKSPIM